MKNLAARKILKDATTVAVGFITVGARLTAPCPLSTFGFRLLFCSKTASSYLLGGEVIKLGASFSILDIPNGFVSINFPKMPRVNPFVETVSRQPSSTSIS